MLVVVFVGGLAGVVVVSRWVWGRVMYTNWEYAEPGVRVYMYYERGLVSLFWCVGVWVVSVCDKLRATGLPSVCFQTL